MISSNWARTHRITLARREPVLIGLREFRNKICAVIREANSTGQRVVILRHGTPTAVLIPIPTTWRDALIKKEHTL